MPTGAVVANESHLGRSKTPSAITRPSLMKELAARRVRMTAQRRLLVGIIQDSPRHLDAATLLELARKQDPDIDRATVYRTSTPSYRGRRFKAASREIARRNFNARSGGAFFGPRLASNCCVRCMAAYSRAQVAHCSRWSRSACISDPLTRPSR